MVRGEDILAQLARHENLCRLKLGPEVSRDDRWVHDRLHTVNNGRSNRVTLCAHQTLGLDVLVYTLGICHVLEHDLTNLQRAFSKANLENLQVPTLSIIVS
jgi:hypothetical protein